MITRYEHKSVTWYDVANPTSEEVRELLQEVTFPAEFADDLTTMTPQSAVVASKGALKVTLDFPIVRRTDIDHPHEVKFIATKDSLITIRFEDIEAMHRYAKEFEVLGMLAKKQGLSGGVLFVSLLTFLYDGLDKKADHVVNRLKDIEEEVFAGKEKDMVFAISKLGRRIIAFRQTLMTHETVLLELPEKFAESFGKKAAGYIPPLQTRQLHLLGRIRSIQRTLEELRETNLALLSTKQNEIMKVFTVLAFLTFPLTLFTSLFSMNTVSTPLVGHPGDFWIILATMIAAAVGCFVFFRYKGWM